ncbi:Omp28-related outer membrane protein [Bacteroidia bacterium]|nr:Omp28-related outer membrane protein [Bacteroidia bacterium]
MNKTYTNIVLLSVLIGASLLYGCKDEEAKTEDTLCPQKEWYADADGDGLGDPNVRLKDCNQPEGFVLNSDDKVDARATSKGVPMVFKVTGETCPPCGGWGWTAFSDLVYRYQGGKALSWGNYGSGFSNGYFRNQEASPTMQAFQDRFAPNSSKPNFVVNGRNYTTSAADAQNAADAFMNTTKPIGMVMNARIEGDRLIIDAEAEVFENAAGTYVLGAYLIEDKALGPQSGEAGANGDAEHHNVMRGSLSDNAWGEVIVEDGLVADTVHEKTFIMDIPKGYNRDNFAYGLIVWKRISTVHIFVNAYATQ